MSALSEQGATRTVTRVLCQHWIWVAILIFFAFAPRAIRTPKELMEHGKWSDVLVYMLASGRMRADKSVTVLAGSKEANTPKEELEGYLGFPMTEAFADRVRTRNAYSYPPFFAWMLTPVTSIGGYYFVAWFWHALMFWMVVLALRLSYLMVFGARACRAPPRLTATAACGLTLASMVLCAAALLQPLSHQQNDTVLLGCMMLGGFILGRRRSRIGSVLAGLAFGIAAGSKGPLLLAVPWLLGTRRWLCGIATAVFAVLLNLAPNAFHHPPSHQLYAVEWYQTIVAPTVGRGDLVAERHGVWAKYNERNQSLPATLSRLLSEDGDLPRPPLFPVAAGTLKALSYGLLLLLLGASFLAIRKARGGRDPDDGAEDPVGLVREIAIVMLLALLASPRTSPAHLCMWVVGVLVFLRDAYLTRDRGLLGLLAVAALPLVLGHKLWLGTETVIVLRYYGLGMWTTVLLLLAGMRACVLARGARARGSPMD